jgi:hypothetical protein
MKTKLMIWIAASAVTLASRTAANAQSYAINWYKIAGGGGASTNLQYRLAGTIGQPDAAGPLTTGNYSLVGGFWGIIESVATPGMPNLTIQGTSPGRVTVSWPATGSYTLQQNASLAPNNWTASGYAVTTANGTNSITITLPVGNLFFRLSDP